MWNVDWLRKLPVQDYWEGWGLVETSSNMSMCCKLVTSKLPYHVRFNFEQAQTRQPNSLRLNFRFV